MPKDTSTSKNTEAEKRATEAPEKKEKPIKEKKKKINKAALKKEAQETAEKGKSRKKQGTRKKPSVLSTMGLGKEKQYFVDNLAMLAGSGMGVIDVLDTIAHETKTKPMKKIILGARDDIQSGSTITEAIRNTGLFKDHALSLIHLGEESGRFIENLEVVSLEQQKDKMFKSKVRTALMYPCFVLAVTVVVGLGISWFILPRLEQLFSGLDVELPWITAALIAFGNGLRTYGFIALPAMGIIGMVVIYYLFLNKKTKVMGENIIFHLPAIKDLIRQVEIARLGFLLGTLIEAGLPITQALDSLADGSSFVKYSRLYRHMYEAILEGESFTNSFHSYKNSEKLVPMPVQQLMFAGEQSGKFAEVLLKIARTYENKTEETAKNLTVLLEPILLLIIFTGVIGVAMAVIMPIYGVLG